MVNMILILATIFNFAYGVGFDHLVDQARYPLMIYAENGGARKVNVDTNRVENNVTVNESEMLSYVISLVGNPNMPTVRLDDTYDAVTGMPTGGGSLDMDNCDDIRFDLEGVTLFRDYDLLIKRRDNLKKDDFCYVAGLMYGLNCYYNSDFGDRCTTQDDCRVDSLMMQRSYEYGHGIDGSGLDPQSSEDFGYRTYQAVACLTANCVSTFPLNDGCVNEFIVIVSDYYWWYWTVPAVFAFILLIAVIVWCTGFCCMALYSNPEQRTARQYKYIYTKKKDKKDKKDKKVIHIHINANPETKNNDVTYAPNNSSSSDDEAIKKSNDNV